MKKFKVTMEKDLYEEGNQVFYGWEKAIYGEETPLSDKDREMFVYGFVMARLHEEAV